ncbi:unnamed protein product [Caenorhabditis bovis]|uniref:Uncharacterized protein n=1 Tax=Caenorhabditis bovis TaxID=2654633 RepID=A0A8S1ENH9_9PELO|nr:unnamed protein product [Caenorhabditis bovis]
MATSSANTVEETIDVVSHEDDSPIVVNKEPSSSTGAIARQLNGEHEWKYLKCRELRYDIFKKKRLWKKNRNIDLMQGVAEVRDRRYWNPRMMYTNEDGTINEELRMKYEADDEEQKTYEIIRNSRKRPAPEDDEYDPGPGLLMIMDPELRKRFRNQVLAPVAEEKEDEVKEEGKKEDVDDEEEEGEETGAKEETSSNDRLGLYYLESQRTRFKNEDHPSTLTFSNIWRIDSIFQASSPNDLLNQESKKSGSCPEAPFQPSPEPSRPITDPRPFPDAGHPQDETFT